MADIEYLAGSITHYPRLITDGIMHRGVCSCGWSADWRVHREESEREWAHHAQRTIQRNVNRRSFSIVGNPLAKTKEN